ncbi:MAG: glycine cleavage system protein GcvH [Trueperaceae bacterium]|nr:MAG: glycine cleavage system protein GcvH [Trueperaceae bacterium]
METPNHLKYTNTHEWAQATDADIVTIGITDYAQDQLGDVVFVELPEVGDPVSAGDPVAVVESVKTASDIYTPVSGEITAVNDGLIDTPEQINESPYRDGWIFKVRLSTPAELTDLLDADGYLAVVQEEDA